MKRTPIIVPGQVYLHRDLNEYLIVTRAMRGNIHFLGLGFGGMHEIEAFLTRFDPVDPSDLTEEEVKDLKNRASFTGNLTTGWVKDDNYDYDED